jgi:hypothetical protein
LWRASGNKLFVPQLVVTCEGAKERGAQMLKVRPEYEPFAWWLTRERIGQSLRERYAVPQEVPPRLLARVRQLGDAVEGDQLREELSPDTPSLLSKLDAFEGNQLLRACRTRLRALCCFQPFG